MNNDMVRDMPINVGFQLTQFVRFFGNPAALIPQGESHAYRELYPSLAKCSSFAEALDIFRFTTSVSYLMETM